MGQNSDVFSILGYVVGVYERQVKEGVVLQVVES